MKDDKIKEDKLPVDTIDQEDFGVIHAIYDGKITQENIDEINEFIKKHIKKNQGKTE